MTRLITAILMFALSGPPQVLVGVFQNGNTTCTLPTLTYDWQFWNSGNYCTSGTTACTNGLGLYKLQDSVASNTATQATGGNQPVYTTGLINGLAGGVFTAANDQYMTLTTAIPTTWTTYSGYVVALVPSAASSEIFLGGTSSTSDLFFTSTHHLELSLTGLTAVSNTTALTTGVWLIETFQYNTSTGAWAFYNCTTGTCVADGSGTGTTGAPSTGMALIGRDSGGYFGSSVAEIAVYNGAINTTQVQSWGSCKYAF